MDNQTENKKQKILDIIALILSAVSILTSVFLSYKTINMQTELLDYQLEQERLPRIMPLNYILPIDITQCDNIDESIDYCFC